MINYELKAEVIKLGFDLLQKDVSKSFYADYVLHSYGLISNHKFSVEEAQEVNTYMFDNFPVEWKEAEKINHAHYARVKRLKDKIASMLEHKCLFLTFTFTDEVLARTSEDTRRQKIIRFLKSYDCPYIANIDYGSKNGREHYHAIIEADKVDYSRYNYGALNGKVVNSANDNVKLAKYIAKLTNHAIKDTARGSRIIYSR